jgi:hypothetical protein
VAEHHDAANAFRPNVDKLAQTQAPHAQHETVYQLESHAHILFPLGCNVHDCPPWITE